MSKLPSLSAVISVALAPLAGCTSVSNQDSLPVSAGKPPAPSVFQYESSSSGFNTKTVFYDNGEEVVAFDAQFTPELAREAIAFAKSKTANPIRYLIVTHPNPDKFNGIPEFRKEGAVVISSKSTAIAMAGVHEYKKYFFVNVAKMFAESAYPALGTVDRTFEAMKTLTLKNGDQVLLRELGSPGVSSTQTIAFVPAAKALIVGDLVHHKAHAWLEGGIVAGSAKPDLRGWIGDLKELRELYASQGDVTVYGGRGRSAPLTTAVDEQIRYLEKADRIVSDYVQKIGDRKTELSNEKAGIHYKALTADFTTAFPDYELGYMIEYGVYGLVNSKVTK